MDPRRLAIVLLLAAALAPAGLAGPARPRPERPCTPEGRGEPPRHWLGCAGDRGAPRSLAGGERLLLGLPLDPNRATAEELALVPGLSRRLGEAVVADRRARGPFASPAEVLRVRGIGPARLAAARPHLAVEPDR
ncbi:MAG TPA: helix-hairpin-helix domain-containing protein [Anaeromyxobacteraceae bacterium]